MNNALEFIQAGLEWAQTLKVGDVFRGSHGEARHRGIPSDMVPFFGAGGQLGLAAITIYTTGDSNIVSEIERSASA